MDAAMLNGDQISFAYAHPLRQRILAQLSQGPATQTEIARMLDMAPASARHHLHKLMAAGFVTQRKTRKGPHGITEKLFETPKSSKGKTPMKWATKHGSRADLTMRKLNLDDVLETHRVGSRIIMRDPAAFFGLFTLEVAATRDELAELRDRVHAMVTEFESNLPPPQKRAKDQKLEHCKLHFGIYPSHPASTPADASLPA